MASVFKKKNKSGNDSYLIQFLVDGKRKTVSLCSKYRQSEVNEFCRLIEELVNARELGREPSAKMKSLLESLPDDMKSKIGRCGLTDEYEELTLWELWERFTDESERGRLRKDSTLTSYIAVQKRFFHFFDKNADPDSIELADGQEWREALAEKYAEATVAGSIQRTRTVFGWAVKRGYCRRNIFLNVRKGSFINKTREFYVPKPWYEKILDACPDQTWRTLVALSRYGGLRNPSETLAVLWSDVNWSENRLLVRSCKTEHIEGHGTRVIPLFPELRIELEKQFDQAEEGEFYVIDHWRGPIQNLRTHFRRIIFRAGLPEWPRLFHNMRGSRSNELFSKFPAHVAAYWMGQSAKVAMEHYLHPTDDQYNQAINTPSQTLQSDTPTKKSKTTKEVGNPSDTESPNKQ